MARISTYPNDATPEGSDIILGNTGFAGETKIFSLDNLAKWLNEYGKVAVIGQLPYKFIISAPIENGTFSLPGYGGDGTAMSSVTNLVFSGVPVGTYNALAYIQSLVGKKVLLAKLNNLANQCVFEMTAIAETAPGSGAYNISLSYQSGSGTLDNNEIYALAAEGLQSQGAVWGSITGNIADQSDLAAYITSVIPDVPYETAQDIVDALNSFGNDGFALSTIPQFSRGIEIGVDDINNSVYSLPDGGLESEIPGIIDKFGYFLLTDPQGNLYWKNFPLEFLAGLDEEAAVDGGTF